MVQKENPKGGSLDSNLDDPEGPENLDDPENFADLQAPRLSRHGKDSGIPLALLEQIFVVAVSVREPSQSQAHDELQVHELRSLIESATWQICSELQLTLKQTHPRQLLGTGQLERIRELVEEAERSLLEKQDLSDGLDMIIVDYELSPTQLFFWEKYFRKPVIDRKALILTLFEQRAQTREARLQVHLARLYYEKPRLKRAWTHLSRQRGGRYGTRGEGETQIEIDARLIEQQIHKLETQLATVQKQRSQQRKRGAHLAHIALIGYTNAGKSALMHALSSKDVYVANRLFATLDPKSSRLELALGEVVLTDTVGFVRKLPHELIEAFRATLEETVLADLQLIVLDAGDVECDEKLATVHGVLRELGVDEKAQLLVLNKMDLLDSQQREDFLLRYPGALAISAQEHWGLDALLLRLNERLEELRGQQQSIYRMAVPHTEGALRAWLYARHLVREERASSDLGQELLLAMDAQQLEQLLRNFPHSQVELA